MNDLKNKLLKEYRIFEMPQDKIFNERLNALRELIYQKNSTVVSKKTNEFDFYDSENGKIASITIQQNEETKKTISVKIFITNGISASAMYEINSNNPKIFSTEEVFSLFDASDLYEKILQKLSNSL